MSGSHRNINESPTLDESHCKFQGRMKKSEHRVVKVKREILGRYNLTNLKDFTHKRESIVSN